MDKQKAIRDAIRGINQALTLIELASEAVGRDIGGREISLARTDCQSARHWLADADALVEMAPAYEYALEHENDLSSDELEEECKVLHPNRCHICGGKVVDGTPAGEKRTCDLCVARGRKKYN